MVTALAMERTRVVEEAMDLQVLASRLLSSDVAEAEDYRALAALSNDLSGLARRCVARDEQENRDHAEMRHLSRRICTILEGLG